MTDEEIIDRSMQMLVVLLGESPEAVRGALVLTSATKAVIDARVDANDALTTQLTLLNRITEVFGG